MNVRLKPEQKIKVLNSTGIYAVMQQILMRENRIRRNQEHFWVVGLNTRNKVLFIELVSLGAVNRAHVAPPDVFRMAIYKLAVRMILVHNHPSGEPYASKDDIDLTDRMLKAGDLLRIEVIDHLVITEDSFLSFSDEGLMEQIRNSGLYVIMEREKAELTEFKLNIERQVARQQKTLEIAKKMKEKGYDVAAIKELTGLGKREIDQL